MKEEVIKGVIAIPKEFYKTTTISFFALLAETGYHQISEQVSEKDIFDTLSLFPRFVDDWLQWSENKRVNEGWCFIKNGNEYNVFYAKENVNIKNSVYQNKIEACASFIKNEIDSVS